VANAKKPRIRKAEPTIRERAEIAQTKAEDNKPSRVRSVVTTTTKPLKKARLPQNQVGDSVRKFGRGVAKVLGWIVPKYFRNSWREVKQVAWPSRRETWRLTGAVFIFAIVFGAMVAVVDKGLDEVFKKLVLK